MTSGGWMDLGVRWNLCKVNTASTYDVHTYEQQSSFVKSPFCNEGPV